MEYFSGMILKHSFNESPKISWGKILNKVDRIFITNILWFGGALLIKENKTPIYLGVPIAILT